MNAIRVRKRIESETVHLPELRPLIGRTVEIIVLDVGTISPGVPSPVCYDAFFALAGQDVVDPQAYKELRTASTI